MPSSTSSSRALGRAGGTAAERAPEKPWLAIWLLAVLVTLGACALLERSLAAHGYRPHVTDSREYWGMFRAEAVRHGERTLALIGTSRLHSGIDPRTIQATLPERNVLQLGISGSDVSPVLEDLAADEGFRGVVVADVTPSSFFADTPDLVAAARDWVRHYHERTLMTSWEPALRAGLQIRFNVLIPSMTATLAAALREGRWPLPEFFRMRRDRFREADYTGGDVAAMNKAWAGFVERSRPKNPEQYRAFLADVEGWVRRIEARGGRVFFVRMPSGGGVLETERALYPRARYWQPLAERFGADAIHFLDFPALNVPCREGSHLDQAEAARFSEGLAAELARRL